jgi:hypothetical protein
MPSLLLRPEVKTTRVGRVVYDRPIHYFDEKDVLRITRNLVKTKPVANLITWILDFLTGITIGLLSDVLALVGAQAFAGPIVNWLVSIGNWVIQVVGDIFSVEYRNLMNWMAEKVDGFNYAMYNAGKGQIEVTYYSDGTTVTV